METALAEIRLSPENFMLWLSWLAQDWSQDTTRMLDRDITFLVFHAPHHQPGY